MGYIEYCNAIRHKINILREEVEVFKSRLEEYDTGHINTTIGVIEHRITQLEEEFIEAQKQRNR